MGYQAKALIVTCSDGRIEDVVERWITSTLKYDGAFVDRIVLPGATFHEQFVADNAKLLYDLHQFPLVIVAHHTDCGALPDHDHEDHLREMREFGNLLLSMGPKVNLVYVLVETQEEKIKLMDFVELYADLEIPLNELFPESIEGWWPPVLDIASTSDIISPYTMGD